MSLRSRLMTVGLVGVAGALLAGGLTLYLVMTRALDRSVDGAARAAAQQVATMVAEGRLPDPVPATGAQVVQVLDSSGRVLAASATGDRLTALVTEPERSRLRAGEVITVPATRAALTGSLRVVAVTTRVPGAADPVLVVAARPTGDIDLSRSVVRSLLGVLLPAALVVMAVIAWRIIGAVLRPVEDLRAGAERIGAAEGDGSARLVVPATRDEIAALATTLNGMLDRLAAARARQRAFVADAAHELRSPLANLRTQLEVADRLGEDGGLAQELLPEVDRLSRLVEDLLILARAGDGAPARTRPVAVADLLADCAARYATARVPVRVTPTGTGTSAGDLTALASPEDLLRVLTNLIDNAVRHATSEVVLAAERENPTTGGAAVVLTVTDDGSGIPADQRERVFDRFARLDDARARDSGGTGLGLSIARALVRRGEGELTLEDAHPGLRAVVRLPAGTADT
ncbi:MAG: HAMP domain-containing sensor histidine kinase [Kineosporiaceae bacterium]